MATAPFPVDPVLSAISVAYRNARMIADQVMPRVPVGKQEFRYRLYDLGERFTIPDTHVGRTSRPNKVEFGFTEETDQTTDESLDAPIPFADIDNAPDGYSPEGHATEATTDLIALAREVRVANKTFTAANYKVGYKTTCSGTSQWSHASSTPRDAISDALDGMVMRANVMALGRATFSKLRRHPQIVSSILGNSGDEGMVTRQQLADLFELDEVLVGEGWVNTAAKGQTVAVSRCWGKHCALLFRDGLADAQNKVTWGYTAQWGPRFAARIPDPHLGARGGVIVRVGESVKELITANDLGYLFEDAVA